MKRALFLVLLICAPLLVAQELVAQKPETTMTDSPQSIAHESNSFAFTVNAPLRDAAPLFGPEGERTWAGEDWNPQFLFPTPARDIEGAVFRVRHGGHTSLWVNTLFDLGGGRMQYVSVLDDLIVTTIDVRLHAVNASRTKVDVTYVRTALRPEANEHVAALGKHDAEQGKVWEAAIDAYLRHRKDHP